MSIITHAELYYGSAKSQDPRRSRERQIEFLETIQVVALDVSAALIYGDIRASLESKGTPIGANDLFIAAIAVTNGLTLVTHNTREFSRVPGLVIEDWESR